MGVPRSVFGELVDVVREEVGPLGFTETVDISAGETGEVNLFNVDDGGYVGIVLSGGPRAFSMRYTTGCRPFPKDAPAANAGRAEAEASGARGSIGADSDGVDALNPGRPGGADRRLGNAESFGANDGEPKVGRHSEDAGELGSAGRHRQGRHRASHLEWRRPSCAGRRRFGPRGHDARRSSNDAHPSGAERPSRATGSSDAAHPRRTAAKLEDSRRGCLAGRETHVHVDRSRCD